MKPLNSNVLLTAYKNTLYKIFYQDKEFKIEVDKRSDFVDKLLIDKGVTSYIFITAANPHSLLVSEAENEKANLELENQIKQKALFYCKGVGESKDGEWKEDSFFVLGISLKEGMSIAKQFSQNAFLYGRKKTKTRLIWAD
ncbi:MAG TPA: DUF3293 domain-containing protein [Leptospiraceae bacterium]|nr:DUF3293 domain-containing protein [Leptospiraceae bacterium]HMW05807.1 DUF3293 domain-containing protein [Leptospiraceae bacterium]HMX34077.1 DUF3293 domain-containing protein [Leptospiraceae bacterium]HMY33912.1 DUF3293 domain-containing protein [Leptospiraceae bacterium]HMZ65853.1 DUF3293 domain-containing protein [Leptospiraceae bacterium]